ncbi:MAG: EamA family transporter [Kiritimatiellae bacterium]|nr:EamA family transporter [Kiritimatiellia bacterium]
MSGRSPERFRGYAWVTLAVLLFSTIEVTAKFAQPGVPPFRLGFFRFFIAGLLLLPFALRDMRARGLRMNGRDLGRLAGLSIVGVVILSICFHLGVQWVPAHQAAILFSGNPVFVAVLAPALLGERMDARGWLALALGALGVGCLLMTGGQGENAAVRPADEWKGVGFTLCAMLSFAFYTVLSKRVVPRHGILGMTSVVSLTGSLLLLPLAWAREGFPFQPMTPVEAGAVAWLAVMTTAVAYVLYFSGINRVPAARGAMLFFLKPITAMLLAWGMLAEQPGALAIIGAVFILAGTGTALLRTTRA